MPVSQIPLPRVISTPMPPAAILRAVRDELGQFYAGVVTAPLPHRLRELVDQMEQKQGAAEG